MAWQYDHPFSTMPCTNKSSREIVLALMVRFQTPDQPVISPRTSRSRISEVSDPIQPDVNRPDIFALRESESASSTRERLAKKFEPGRYQTCSDDWRGRQGGEYMPMPLRSSFGKSRDNFPSVEQERPKPQPVGCQTHLPVCGTNSRNPVTGILPPGHRRRTSQCWSNRVKW